MAIDVSRGSKVVPSTFTNFQSRLNTVRSRHGLSSWTISGPVATGNPVRASTVQNIKDNISNLSSSAWISSSYANNITVPTVGTILQIGIPENIDSVVSTLEGICAFNSHCSFCEDHDNNSGFFSGHGQFKYGGYCHGG